MQTLSTAPNRMLFAYQRWARLPPDSARSITAQVRATLSNSSVVALCLTTVLWCLGAPYRLAREPLSSPRLTSAAPKSPWDGSGPRLAQWRSPMDHLLLDQALIQVVPQHSASAVRCSRVVLLPRKTTSREPGLLRQ